MTAADLAYYILDMMEDLVWDTHQPTRDALAVCILRLNRVYQKDMKYEALGKVVELKQETAGATYTDGEWGLFVRA